MQGKDLEDRLKELQPKIEQQGNNIRPETELLSTKKMLKPYKQRPHHLLLWRDGLGLEWKK